MMLRRHAKRASSPKAQALVSVVQGSDRNIKITKPTDMDLARLFFQEQQEPSPALSPGAART